MDMTAYAPLFASPHAGSSEAIVRKLAGARLRRLRRNVEKALMDAGETKSAEGLLAFVEGTESAWQPETGLSLLTCRTNSRASAAIQVAAALAVTGGTGSLEARVESTVSLYLDGSVIEVEGPSSLSADGRTVVITSDRGRSLFVPSDRCWVTAQPVGPWRSQPTSGRAPRYVTATEFSGNVERFPWMPTRPPTASPYPPSVTSTEIATIGGSWQLIAEKAPVYSSWVASTAVGCALLKPSGRGHQSASSSDRPGLIAIEPPACPVFCGEMLVHECSHQQLLAYTSLVPLVNAESEETCYSPIKRSRRPLLNVLFGAHAVGNMILYYAELQRRMELDEASVGRFRAQCTWFAKDYRVALGESQSLTGAGRLLWSRLCEVVDEQLGSALHRDH